MIEIVQYFEDYMCNYFTWKTVNKYLIVIVWTLQIN